MQSCTIFCTSVQCLPRVRRSSCCGGQFLGKFLATCVTLPGPPICSSSCCFLLRMLTVAAWLGSAFTRLLTGDWPLIPAQDKSDSTGHCLDYECILVRQRSAQTSQAHTDIYKHKEGSVAVCSFVFLSLCEESWISIIHCVLRKKILPVDSADSCTVHAISHQMYLFL